MISTSETGHRSYSSPVEAESVGRAMLAESSASESQLLAIAAAMRGTSVGGHNRARRIRGVAEQLEARAHRRMLLRACRAAVQGHARRDPYAAELIGPEGWVTWTRADAVRDRLWEIQARRSGMGGLMPEQRRRIVAECVQDAEIKGLASTLDPGFARHADEIVIQIRYAETWTAIYAVCPDGRAVCWMD